MGNHVIYDALWESDKLAKCSREAALAYPWIFLVADDHGRFEYKARMVWKHAFAYRQDVSVDDVAGWLDEYWKVGLLTRYHIYGELAVWYKFRGRKPSDRKKSEYPDPEGMPVLTPDTATVPPRRGDDVATTPMETRARDRSEIDQIRAETDQSPAAVAAPSDHGVTLGGTPAKPVLIVAPLAWNREAAELWHHEYKGDPPKAFFAALKPLVKREGWERVRPALVTYMAETPADYVNVAGKFVAAFGTWVERARGKPRSPPSKQSVGDRTVAAMLAFSEGECDKQGSVLDGLRQIGSGSTSDARRSDPDGLPRGDAQ